MPPNTSNTFSHHSIIVCVRVECVGLWWKGEHSFHFTPRSNPIRQSCAFIHSRFIHVCFFLLVSAFAFPLILCWLFVWCAACSTCGKFYSIRMCHFLFRMIFCCSFVTFDSSISMNINRNVDKPKMHRNHAFDSATTAEPEAHGLHNIFPHIFMLILSSKIVYLKHN